MKYDFNGHRIDDASELVFDPECEHCRKHSVTDQSSNSTEANEKLYVKVAYTLQTSGIYPYPEFVKPLVKLITESNDRAELEGRIDELDKMGNYKEQWERTDINDEALERLSALKSQLESMGKGEV